MDLIARSVSIRGGLSVIALAGGVYMTRSIVWALVLVAAVWGLTLVAHDIPRACRALPADLRPRWVTADLARLLRISLPLGITVMLISLSMTIPRYVLERYHGEHELGTFAALAYLMVIGSTLANALGQSVSSRLARYYARGDEVSARQLLRRLICLGLLLGGAGGVAALVGGEEILTLLYRPEYAQHRTAFVILMAATGIGYVTTFLYYAVTAARVFRPQLLLFVGVVGVTVIASIVLIPSTGLLGAAEATAATSVAALLGTAGIYVYALRRLNRRGTDQGYSRRPPAAADA
jgi:O-antigen/teichoic acid export membrane protein